MDKQERGVSTLPLLIMLGCLWGVQEALAGVYLRGTCARMFSGSLLMGGAFFFGASAYAVRGRLFPLLLLPVIATVFRVYAALLAGTSLFAMAVANPVYAFFTETLALMLILALLGRTRTAHVKGRMAVGALSAVAGAGVFPAVGLVTGISACVVPGTRLPLALYGLPVAAALSILTVPLGFPFGQWLERGSARPATGNLPLSWKLSAAVLVLGVIVVTAVHA